jgi:hypothetical protein
MVVLIPLRSRLLDSSPNPHFPTLLGLAKRNFCKDRNTTAGKVLLAFGKQKQSEGRQKEMIIKPYTSSIIRTGVNVHKTIYYRKYGMPQKINY